MKPDEIKLFKLIAYKGDRSVREIVEDPATDIHPKRCAYLLEKWSGKGWYDYGFSVLGGWLTDEGKAVGKSLLNQDDSVMVDFAEVERLGKERTSPAALDLCRNFFASL